MQAPAAASSADCLAQLEAEGALNVAIAVSSQHPCILKRKLHAVNECRYGYSFHVDSSCSAQEKTNRWIHVIIVAVSHAAMLQD